MNHQINVIHICWIAALVLQVTQAQTSLFLKRGSFKSFSKSPYKDFVVDSLSSYIDIIKEHVDVYSFDDYIKVQNPIQLSPEYNLTRLNDGHWLQYLSQDRIGRAISRQGNAEHLINQIILKLVKPGFIVVDLGANYGVTSLSFGQMAGQSGKVYAIEASPPVLEVLANNIVINGYSGIIFPFNKVISDTAGGIKFNVNPIDSYSSLVGSSSSSETIEGVTVDQFMEQMNETKPLDFLRVDIQGYECKALKGARQSILKNPNIILFFEWERDIALLYLSENDLRDCLEWLESNNFTLWQLPRNLDLSIASKHTLSMSTANEIIGLQQKEIIAVRNNSLLEGLYFPRFAERTMQLLRENKTKSAQQTYINFKEEITHEDFWKLPKDMAILRLTTGKQRLVNMISLDNSMLNLFDYLKTCFKEKNLKCEENEDFLEVAQKLKDLGQKCSQTIHQFFKRKQSKHPLYLRFCFK